MIESEELQEEIIFDFSRTFKCFAEDTNLNEIVDELIATYSLELPKVWLAIWQDKGHDILNEIWISKYGHQLADNCENETNNLQQTEAHAAIEESSNNWQLLWDDHVSKTYEKYFHHFDEAFWLYREILEKSERETDIDSIGDLEIEDADVEIENLESDLECMKLLGLPTSFSNSHKKLKKTQKKINSCVLKNELDYLEETEEEEDYSSGSDSLDMAKISEVAESSKPSGLQKINKNKKKKNRKLRNVPEFLRDGNNLLKYWRKRYSLFSRFDQGIQMDQESWFSVTPEKVARNLAQRLSCDIIVDGFCGCGGNTIQFANFCQRVIAIDIDASKIAMARKNAEIYGVAHKIDFIVDDFLKFCGNTKLKADVVFLSPPWGGPKYKKSKNYDIEQSLEPTGATELMQSARNVSQNVVFFLPRNANVQQVIKLAGIGNSCEIQHNFLNERLIAITAFYGTGIIQEKLDK